MTTAALVLAAGQLSDEQSQRHTEGIGNVSSIKRLIMIFRQSGIKKIVVITGFGADTLKKNCAHMGAVFLHNDTYESADMFSSVKIGLKYLKDKCSKTFVSPANCSLFSSETVKKMKNAAAPVVIPMYNNKTGHPILLSESVYDNVLRYTGSAGLEGALSGENVTRRFFEVSDSGILKSARNNADSPDNTETLNLPKIRPDMRIKLIREKAFFGPGTYQLLGLTAETGSLKVASQQMGISYSKAWKMIADVEAELGVPVLFSRQGGQQGGGSEITEKGLELMKRYESFESECNQFVQQSFSKHFDSNFT